MSIGDPEATTAPPTPTNEAPSTLATAQVGRFEAARLARLLLRPAELFVKVAAQGGVLLVLALVAGMVWKNSAAGDAYDRLWQLPVTVALGAAHLELTVLGVINDVLMAVFFLVVGAEIKHELVVGELRGLRRAAVPALAAVGGMLVPAALYVLIASEHKNGFGTPMATDIAFALAAIRALGTRVPTFVVKVLVGLAIIDDLGAIVVIAVFYGGDLDVTSLSVGLGCAAVLVVMNLAGVWRVVPYLIVGVPLWLALHHGGVHPTIAGVVVGLCIPARVARARGARGAAQPGEDGDDGAVDEVEAEARVLRSRAARAQALVALGTPEALAGLERWLEQNRAPLERLVTALSPWIHWIVLPLFALANGGVALGGLSASTLVAPVSLGIVVGLFVGKQLGIFLTVMGCVKVGLLPLPEGVRPGHVWGMSILGGVGFTMSLFVAGLAFAEGSALHNEAKAGILLGSTLSVVAGVIVLRLMPAAAPVRLPA